jgi:hypothetical protein
VALLEEQDGYPSMQRCPEAIDNSEANQVPPLSMDQKLSDITDGKQPLFHITCSSELLSNCSKRRPIDI